MTGPIERIEPWPTVEQPTHHLVVFTDGDVWWQHERPDLPGWLEVRVFAVSWEQRYETGRDIGGMSIRTGPGSTETTPAGLVIEWSDVTMLQWPSAPPPEAPREMGFSYQRADGYSNMDTTFDWAEAEPAAAGSVKWDGCVNYSIGSNVLAHACDPVEIGQVAAAFIRAVEIAYEVMEVDRG